MINGTFVKTDGLSEAEKEQLMNAIESDVQELQIKKDEIESSISKEN